MTVRLEGSIKRWLGLSTDEKPYIGLQADGSTITAADLPAGSSFMETDTGDIYRWDANVWTLPTLEDETLYVLQALLMQVTQLRELVALAIGA